MLKKIYCLVYYKQKHKNFSIKIIKKGKKMKFSPALLAVVCGALAFGASAYEYTFSGDKNVMDSFRYGRWMPAEKMNKETSCQNVDGRVLLIVSRENPAWYPKTDEIMQDGIVKFKYQLANTGNVLLRVRTDYNTDNHYFFQVEHTQKRVNFFKRFRNKTIPLGKGYFNPPADKKYDVQAICKGNQFLLKINGQEVGPWTDNDSPLLKGICGFGSNWGSKFFPESFSYQNADVQINVKKELPPAAPAVEIEKKK